MAKKIFMSDTDIESVVNEIRSTLAGMKCYGNIDIKRSLKQDDRTAWIWFTPNAWAKMATLVARYDTEVQWHGLVRRQSDFGFEIYDIVVPPHEVTGTTVTSEYKPYGDWLNGLDDETFNAVKFHGHSHVNMPVSPSSTDEKYRLDLITQLPKPVNGMDVFYIFMIINKRHQWSAEIYDLTNNALYSTADIDVDVCLNDYGESLEEFMTETKKVAVGRSTHTGSYGGHYSGGRYGGNVGGRVGNNGKQPTSVAPVSRVGSVNSSAKTSTKEKNKSKKNEGEGKRYEYGTLEEYYAAVYGVDADDDLPLTHEEDDPTNPFYVREWGYT